MSLEGDNLVNRFAFNAWANLHLTRLLAQLTHEELHAENGRFYWGSAWTLLLHMLQAERGWLNNCMGADMTGNVWNFPATSIGDVIAYLEQAGPAHLAYVASLSAEELVAPVDISHTFGDAPRLTRRCEVLTHIINHSTEHRCDLAHFLTDHNLSPDEMGYLDFLVASRLY